MAKTVTKGIGIVPLGDRVVVELIMTAESEGGIILPEKRANCGYVRAIGLGVPGELVAGDEEITAKSKLNARGFRVGDKVYLPRGDSVGEKFPTSEGGVLLVLPSSHIAVIIEES